MNFRRRSAPVTLGFQIAPMVDILLVLLVFFIVTWNFARTENELDIKLPAASNAKEQQPVVSRVVLNIRPDGTVVLNRKPISKEELKEKLTSLAELYPDQAVIIRADKDLPYGDFVSVMNICNGAKIWNINLNTASIQPGEE